MCGTQIHELCKQATVHQSCVMTLLQLYLAYNRRTPLLTGEDCNSDNCKFHKLFETGTFLFQAGQFGLIRHFWD